VQALPALFPVLRALVDEARLQRGRYYLLGSVNPELLRDIAESLAGRVGIVELTPFLYAEAARRRGVTIDSLWLRGGFPDALLARGAEAWDAWHESYLRTFIERDVARQRLRVDAAGIRRLMGMLAHSHAGLLNYSNLGRALGLSYHTVQNLLDLLEGHFLVRRLAPFHANLGKRLVRAAKVYIRDSGLLHHLLGVSSAEALLTSPARGNSFEGFMVEQVIALERLQRPASQFWFLRAHTGMEIDLIIDRGTSRLGLEFKAGVAVEPRDWAHLRSGIDSGIIQRGCVVYHGARAFDASPGIRVLPAVRLLQGDWLPPR
jgi:predicted AAA+ superfamily ATPase